MLISRGSRAAGLLLVCTALGCSSLPAAAMNVSPMAIELITSGSRSTARIQVVNENVPPLPFETRVYRIEIDEHDKITETPADADFIVFPPQGVIQQHQRQMIRLQWLGGQLDSSHGYYVAINQIPVSLDHTMTTTKDKPQVDVQVVYHMKVLVTVAPPKSSPIVKVESAQPAMVPGLNSSAAPGQTPALVPGVIVTVTNTGRRYAMMAGVNWTIEGRGTDGKPLKVVLSSSKMGELLGAGYLPALNGKRTFQVPTGVQFANGRIDVKFAD